MERLKRILRGLEDVSADCNARDGGTVVPPTAPSSRDPELWVWVWAGSDPGEMERCVPVWTRQFESAG